jgi:acyl carrier protein
LSEVLDNDSLKLTEATTADTVEDWDSINHVRLLIGIESDMGIQFETDEVSSVKNVGGLIDLITAKLA